MVLKKIAVVILNWNGKQLLEQFVPAVVAYSQEASIYVVDNASTDDSISFLETYYPEVSVLRNTDNYGFAEGYNRALETVPEPIWCLLNSDVEVTENWLLPILELFEKNTDIAIIQPKIKDFKNKEYFEYAGAAGGFIDRFGFPFCRGRLFDTLEPDTGQYNDQIDIAWASGACFFIRKETFVELKGFDTAFFAHQEEIDLCWRARNLGRRIVYCPHVEVYHVGGATLNASHPKKTLLNFRNSLYMLTKNLPKNQLLWIIFIRLVMDGLAGIQLFFQGKFKHTFAILQAHFQYYAQLSRLLRKRTVHQKTDYYYTSSIVYLYFLRKRKRFYEI